MMETTEGVVDADADALRGVVEEVMDRLHVPGVAVGIVHQGPQFVIDFWEAMPYREPRSQGMSNT